MYIDLSLSTDKLHSQAERIQQRQLSTPLLLFLYGNQPLAFVCGQCLHFITPMLNLISPNQAWHQWANLFSSTTGMDDLIRSLEEVE